MEYKLEWNIVMNISLKIYESFIPSGYYINLNII